MTKTFCKIAGFAFLLIGVVGIFSPSFLGMHLSPAHNLVHMLSGIVALYFGFFGTLYAARLFCVVFGGIYFLLGVLGFVTPGLVTAILYPIGSAGFHPDLTPDNVVHLLLGTAFVMAGAIPWYVASHRHNRQALSH